MKASGISLYRAITPMLIAAVLVTGAMIWFNNEVLPEFNHRARILAGDIARKKPGVSIEPGVWYNSIPDYGLLVQELADSLQAEAVPANPDGITIARNLLIDDHSEMDYSRIISARRGYLEVNPRLGALVITLFDGELQELDFRKLEELRHVTFTKHVLSIEVDDMFLRRSESEYRGDREKSAQQMRQEVAANRQQLGESLKTINEHVARDLYRTFGTTFGISRVATDSALSVAPVAGVDGALPTAVAINPARPANLYVRDPAASAEKKAVWPGAKLDADSIAAQTRQEKLNLLLINARQALYNIQTQLAVASNYERTSNSLLVEIHKKYSIPVACLVFVIIGAPLGFMARRGGLAAGGGLSLGFFLLYWAFLIGGEDLADRQYISPFVAMWAANFIVGLFGLYLLRRAARENVTLDFRKILWWRRGK
jgi:lipopolysaccharide export system permease protein